jgi:hypothetical protein
MSEEPSRVARNVTLMISVQEEMDNVIRANTVAMNEQQLRNHIQEIYEGVVALVQLPTTNTLNELLKEKQYVKDTEAQI